MLNPNQDRLDYGKLLAPPEGYVLDFAVGTTYSLDLQALTHASMALGLSEDTDSELMKNPICVLEALRATGDRVALFCESGQIHVPNKPSKLFVLLEKMVYQVQTAKEKGSARYPSFHPKVWLIRYAGNEDAFYRVIVLSRNLTFDRSWDVAFSMDGEVQGKRYRKNDGLCDFLSYLREQLPATDEAKIKSKSIRDMIEELPYVRFKVDDKGFVESDYEFIPHGVKDREGNVWAFDETALFQGSWKEIFVISPFLSGDVMRMLNDRVGTHITSPRYTLITRKMSLAKIKSEDVSNFKDNIYVMRDEVVEGEDAISDETADTQRQDIHAKLYMTRKGTDADLYVGSLNASHNAIHGNIEFMIRLGSSNRYLNTAKLKEALFGDDPDGKDNPFRKVDLEGIQIDKNEEANNLLNNIIKDLCRANPRANVIFADGMYSVRVCFEEIEVTNEVYIRPLLSNKKAYFAREICIDGLSLMQLSEFFVISVSDGQQQVERVIKIKTEGLPEERESEVVNSIIENKQCFYHYVSFLLGDDAVIGSMEALESENVASYTSGRGTTIAPALYEKMLKAASDDVSRLDGIDYLLRTVSKDGVIPEDFEKLYNTIKRAVKLDG